MSFSLTFFEDNMKPHLIPSGLGLMVCQDLWDRYKAVPLKTVIKKADELFRIDAGGSMLIDAEWITVRLDDLNFEVPVRDVQRFYTTLMNEKPRTLGKGRTQYFKLHGWIHAVVLTPAQRTTLLKAWGDAMPAYRERAAKENERFQRALSGVAGKEDAGATDKRLRKALN